MPGRAIWLFVSLTVVCGCSFNADRDNPLDPHSPDYTAVFGRVEDRGRHPIPGALVAVSPQNVISLTDNGGFYRISGLEEGTQAVRASASGYEPDSHEIEVERGHTLSMDFQLNAMPYFEWVNSVSAHEPIWPLDIYYAELTASPGDADGSPDIESLAVEVADLSYRRRMDFDHNLGCFHHVIRSESLPGGSLHELVGKEITFTVIDKQGSCGQAVSRVIRTLDILPQAVSPAHGEPVGPSPILRWQFSSSFTVTYSVRVHATQPPGLAWSIDSIPQVEDSIQVADSLAQGPHYWTITAVDEFGNWSRSEEASFVVE